MVNEEGFKFAIGEIKDGFIFENYVHCLLGHTLGYDFIPVGGSKDGGVDGLQFVYTINGKENQIFQISTESDVKGKIDDTISKLQKNRKTVSRLTYVSSRKITNIDKLCDDFFDKFKIPLRIFDLNWLSSHSNDSTGAIQCYYTFIDSYLHEFKRPDKSVVVSNLDSDSRIYVYLRQQLERTETTVKLDEILADGLILFALEGTDPDKGVFKTRSEIIEKVKEFVKFSSETLSELIDNRLEFLTTKPRSVKYHSKAKGYCLPYETRLQIQERNLIDGSLVKKFLEETKEIIKKYLDNEDVSVRDTAKLINETIHKIYHQQGLEFSNFILNGDNKDVIEKKLRDVVANVVDNSSVIEKNRTSVKNAVILTIRDVVYNGSEDQIKYLKCLSNTYLTMFMLQWDPQVATFFQAMVSNMNIFVDNSIIIPALSEFYLEEKNKRHWNLLKGAKKSGINLLINETILDELVSHFRMLRGKYYNLFQPMEDVYSSEGEVLFINEILIRSYYYAKMKGKVSSYDDYVDNFVDPDLRSAKEDLTLFLQEEFGITFSTNEELGVKVDKEKYDKVVAHLKDEKSAHVKAENDTAMILTIYKMREVFKEHQTTGIFGYKTWWLSKDTKTYKSVIKVLGEDKYPISCYMRPDFIYNYIALSPNKEEVDDVYQNLFPSLLGVNISYHIPKELSEIIQKRMAEFADKPPHRLKAIMRRLSDRLKSDPRIRNRTDINHYLDEELEKLKLEE